MQSLRKSAREHWSFLTASEPFYEHKQSYKNIFRTSSCDVVFGGAFYTFFEHPRIARCVLRLVLLGGTHLC